MSSRIIVWGDGQIDEAILKDDVMVAEMQPLIDQITRRLMYTFRRFVEADDVAQSIWVYYLENRRELDRYADSNVLRVRLRRAGSLYCQREMAYRLGIDVGHQYEYSKGEIRALVEFALSGGPQGKESQGMLAAYVDVCRGLQALDGREYEVLRYAYGPDAREALTSVERATASRAVCRLHQILNEPSEMPPEPRS